MTRAEKDIAMKVLNVLCFSALLCCGLCRGADATVYTTTTNGVTWTWTLSNGGAMLGGDWSSPAVSKDTAGALVVPETLDGHQVVGLSEYAFYRCKNLSSVSLPSSVSVIGYGAFRDCEALRSMTIPDNTTNIGSSVFSGCSALTNVVIGSGITAIPNSAFYGCTGLRSFVIPDHITSLGSSVFSGCSALTNVVIGSGITEIPSYAFQSCSSLQKIDIPDTVTTFDYSAFYNCTGLRSFVIPDHITSIGSSVFSGCSGLTNVVIGSGITAIPNSAFYGCTSLRSIAVPDHVTAIDNSAFYNCTGLREISFGSGVTSIGDSAFHGCVGLQGVSIPQNVTSVGSKAFYNCSGLREVAMPNPSPSIGSAAFSGCVGLVDADGFLIVANRLFVYRGASVNVVVPDTVVAIDDSAFSGCTTMQNVVIPSSVSSIGASAFAGCTGLVSVDIPDSVKTIGNGAFRGCTGLVDDDGFLIVRNVLCAYAGRAGNVTVPDSVVRIDDGAFEGCAKIRSISLPPSLEMIGDFAFKGCTGLEQLVIPAGVETIGDSAFQDCHGLTSLVLPANVTSLGSDLFWGCTLLKSLTIPQIMCMERYWYWYVGDAPIEELIVADGVTTIEVYPFDWNYSNIRKLVIPNSVTRIGYYFMRDAFYGLDKLVSITIPQCISGSQRMYEVLHYSDNLRELVIADGATSIGSDLFQGCSQLESVAISASVTDIEAGAFSALSELKSVYFRGDAPKSVSGAFNSVGSSCVVYVERGSSGWNVDIPGVWQGVPIRYVDCAVTFDAAGGVVEENLRTVRHDSEIGELPSPSRVGYRFLGWFTQSEGGEHVTPWTVADGDMTCFAQWEKIVVPAPVISPDDGISFAGRGCEVSISCADGSAEIFYSTNGVTPRPTAEFAYRGAFVVSTTTTVKAVAVMDGVKSDYVSAAFVRRELTLAEAAGAPELPFATCDNAAWTPCLDETATSGMVATSGVIGERTNTWLETTVEGAGTLSFFWRVECEEDGSGDATWDRLMVFTNGVEIARIDGETDWQRRELTFFDDGVHTVRWTFLKDDYDECEHADAAWVSGVTWKPGLSGAAVDVRGEGAVERTDDGYLVTANGDGTLTAEDVTVYTRLGDRRVETTQGYKIVVADDGKSVSITLASPAIGATDAEADVEKDEDDPSGALVVVDESRIASRPTTKSGESVGALPVKTCAGLYYQAAWGNDLGDMTVGDKVQANGERLYLGVIRQTGDKGFYRVSITDR